MVKRCCVRNCGKVSTTTRKLHRFPNNSEMVKKWLVSIDRVDLSHKSIEQIRNTYRVCSDHFAANQKFIEYHNRTNLKYNELPTINLPEVVIPSTSVIPQDKTHKASTSKEVVPSYPPEQMDITSNTPPCREALIMNSDAPPSGKISQKLPKTRKELRRKINFLRIIGCTRKRQLSPKPRKLYSVACRLKKNMRIIEKENVSYKRRMKEALEYAHSKEFLRRHLNAQSANFVISQLKHKRKKSRGRRYTLDEKIYALSLLKLSPKAYLTLKQTFALPSRKTLTGLLNKVPFNCGINNSIMQCFKSSVSKMDVMDRYCTLVFDEMSIALGLHYDKRGDKIDGFQNCGDGIKKAIADHAMVFMARGIRKKWKQPIAFFFSEAGMNAPGIVRNIKEIILSLKDIGLCVVATVSDQHATNTRAIKMLNEETERHFQQLNVENRAQGYLIGGDEVIHLYDVPHLLKGLRNNLLKSNLQFVWKKGPQVASWKDVIQLYEMDIGDYDTKMLNKLTDQHIYPDKIKKMKVKNAAQVFSHRVSSTMRVFSNKGDLNPSGADTADLLLFIDKLFDSMNSISKYMPEEKSLRCAVSTNSSHINFWNEAVQVLNSMKFINPNGRQSVPPSIKNWVITMENTKYLWIKLAGVGFKYLCTRNLNQDPVENFFGCIRSHGIRNINPTSHSFITSFKSLIVSNFRNVHSPAANCEEDVTEGALSSLRELLCGPTNVPVPFIATCPVDNFDFSNSRTNNAVYTHAYIAGFVAKKIMKNVGKCRLCIKDLLTNQTHQEHTLITARAYHAKALLKPTTRYTHLFAQMIEVGHEVLPQICTNQNLKQLLKNIILRFVKPNFTCQKHNVFSIFVNHFVQFYIHCWIVNINRILKGSDFRNINDEIKKLAIVKYKKIKARK